MSVEIIQFFFDFQLNLKFYHWNTTSFSRHKASDSLGDKLSKLIDKFVEVYMGRYGRPKVNSRKMGVEYSIISDKDMVNYLKTKRDYLEKMDIKGVDLLNIRDEIVENIDQTLYLFTLE
jgi:DNA-binding ferritin-like protein